MGLLDDRISGGEQQGGFQDFVNRYEQGAPHEGIGEQETVQRHGQVAGQVDPGTYQQSAQEAMLPRALTWTSPQTLYQRSASLRRRSGLPRYRRAV